MPPGCDWPGSPLSVGFGNSRTTAPVAASHSLTFRSLDPDAMTTAVSALCRDAAAQARLRQALAALQLRNGVDVATDAVSRLLDRVRLHASAKA